MLFSPSPQLQAVLKGPAKLAGKIEIRRLTVQEKREQSDQLRRAWLLKLLLRVRRNRR